MQVDVEANTLAVLAFRYTSITSVTMLDAFSLPGECIILLLQLATFDENRRAVGMLNPMRDKN